MGSSPRQQQSVKEGEHKSLQELYEDTHGNDLGTNERKRGLFQYSDPAKEPTLGTADVIELGKRSGVFPVPETETVVVGTAAEIENDTQDNEPGDREDFDGREDEFSLAIGAYGCGD